MNSFFGSPGSGKRRSSKVRKADSRSHFFALAPLLLSSGAPRVSERGLGASEPEHQRGGGEGGQSRPECSDVLQSRGCENRGFCKEDDRLFKPECFLRVSRGIGNLDRLPGALIVHRLSVEACSAPSALVFIPAQLTAKTPARLFAAWPGPQTQMGAGLPEAPQPCMNIFSAAC